MKTILQSLFASAVFLGAGCVIAQEPTPVVQNNPPSSVVVTNASPMTGDASFFYDQLAPYGRWFWLEPYGWVWTPNNVDVAWRPYTEGNWVYADYGWTWVSDFEWGWAPFHYGRWCWHEHHGWCWVPDRVWGPAWVSWHFGDMWCGWAPLPPGVAWEPAVNWDVLIPPFGWCFVGREDFLRPHLRDHIVVSARNVTLLAETRNVTRFEFRDNRVFNASISAEQMEHFTGRPVRRLKLVDVDSVAATRTRVGGELHVFRPAARPGVVVTVPHHEMPAVIHSTPSVPTLDELRIREAERARLEAAQRAQREALEHWHERELHQPPRGLSPGELQQRHEAEHRAFEEQMSRERQLFEHRAPSPPPQRPAGPQRLLHSQAGREPHLALYANGAKMECWLSGG
jgi:hypothetical protein